eukprot:RCo018275
MAMINVDPEKQEDAFYRYKMPKAITKVEGNGNGIKTVVVNIIDIADRLARNVEYPMKYFAHDLAVTAKFKDEKWILTGAFPQDRVQNSLFDFIKKFVLCKACRNPETVIIVDERKDLFLNCKACSRVTPIDAREKLCNLLIKGEQESAPVHSKKEDKKAAKKGKSSDVKTKDQKEEEEFNKNTREAKADDKITEEVQPSRADLPNPVEVLREFVNEQPAPSDLDISGKVFDMKNDYGLDDGEMVMLLFESLFDENIIKQIPERAKLLRRFLKPETEKKLILSLMLLCVEKAAIKPKFAVILKKFYDCEVLSEGAIVAWYDGRSTKHVAKDDLKLFKEKAKPFIEWLKKPEESDEESEEEEDQPARAAALAAPEAQKGDDEDVDIENI